MVYRNISTEESYQGEIPDPIILGISKRSPNVLASIRRIVKSTDVEYPEAVRCFMFIRGYYDDETIKAPEGTLFENEYFSDKVTLKSEPPA